MCTTEQRDEIIAEILVCHTGMPRRYAAWFVSVLTDVERSFVTKAAIRNRHSLVRDIQRNVHLRRAKDRRFPENICVPQVDPPPAKRRKPRKLHSVGGRQGYLFWP